MTTYNESQRALVKLVSAAMYSPWEDAKPAQEAEISGFFVRCEFFITSRKCFDNMPTPTRLIKVNGKRISFNKAIELLA
jgi:hypothetical protein